MATKAKMSLVCRVGLLAGLMLSLFAGQALAQGGSGGGGGGNSNSRITGPGFCAPNGSLAADPDTTAEAVLTKIDNQWRFAIQVVGQNSVGDWDITWTKNNVFNSTSQILIPPPGGWTFFGLSTNPGEKGTVSFQAIAVSKTGEKCSAMISIKI